ncbi:hypothetical protein [Sphingomonas sp.]|uniref:hypothetical protein n=1 Tax=Sphingomonas sp. TaxID=28214 RepID=UPI0035C8553C
MPDAIAQKIRNTTIPVAISGSIANKPLIMPFAVAQISDGWTPLALGVVSVISGPSSCSSAQAHGA